MENINNDNKNITCSFYGLGLIGGSISRALRKAYPGIYLKAYDSDPRSIEAAYRSGVINKTYTMLTDDIFDCDYMFLCAPVSANDSFI